MIALVWKEKQDISMLMSMHNPPVEGNFGDEHGNAIKPATVDDYSKHMDYVDGSDRIANSYSICNHTWKWTKKLLTIYWISLF
jgi:hypothetical protein